MTTLYLHIGTHRTATSSIQAFMVANWETLLARGILHPMRTGRHHAVFNSIFSGQNSVKQVSLDLQERARRLPAKIDSILLSDEDVCTRHDLSQLAEFRNDFDVKVIFALRRQDLWLESWYLQNIKWQWNKSLSHCTLAEFLARAEEFHWIHYDRLLGHLDQVFGQENVLPYVYEKAQMPDGPVAAFCNRIGLTDLSGMIPAPQLNSSYSPSIAEFVRRLPLDEAPDKYRAELESVAQGVDLQLAPLAGDNNTLLIDYETRMRILATHAEGNANIARRYFNRDDLFLDELPGPAVPLANMSLPTDSGILMRDYVAPMIRGLIKQYVDSAAKS